MTRRRFLQSSGLLFPFFTVSAKASVRSILLSNALQKPSSFSSCRLWLDSNSLSSLADGDAIASWNDSSGSGNHATQGTAGNRPEKQTYSLGGRTYPVYYNNASTKWLVTPSMLGSSYNTAFTAFCAHYGNDPANLRLYAATATLNVYLGQSTVGTFYSAGLSDNTIQVAMDQNATQSRMQVISFRYNGSQKVARTNGFQRVVESATGNLGMTGALTIGRVGGGGYEYNGRIAQFALFDRALTDREMYLIERWMALATGISTAPNLACDGDSITYGTCSTAGNNYPSKLQASLGLWTMNNFGIPSQTLADMTTLAPGRVDPFLSGFDRRNVLCVFGGTNDLYFGASAATAYSRLVTYCQARQAAGWKVAVFTILPRSGAGTPGTFEADRQTVNTSIRNNWTTFADALVDTGGDATIGAAGASESATYYCDKIHPTDAGYAIIASIAKDSITSLTA